MPLRSDSLPSAIAFFTSSAWTDLRQLLEASKPAYPPVAADALTTTSQCRRREGYEMCLEAILREAGGQPQAAPDPEPKPQATGNPMTDAMQEMLRDGTYVDTQTD